jgi:N6-L-threonylcarbamoyladenine synthase
LGVRVLSCSFDKKLIIVKKSKAVSKGLPSFFFVFLYENFSLLQGTPCSREKFSPIFVPSMALLLAIESSCDETAAALIQNGRLLTHHLSSQFDHAQYGGVVPELASRLHQQQIIAVVEACFQDEGISPAQIDAVAVTQGPGLMGALWVGVSFAKAFALARNIPLIGVNHLEAHVLSHFLNETPPPFPFLCLTVSGGHTQIIIVKDFLNLEIIGETLDDAAGEAFDKGAKMLGLPYPGGPLIDRYATQGNPEAYAFPAPDLKDLKFSFSGLKTALLYFLKKQEKSPDFVANHLPDICASYQKAIIGGLIRNLAQAAERYGIQHLALAGGVSANSGLRQAFLALCKQKSYCPYLVSPAYCTDNAAMIGIAGWYKWQAGQVSGQDMMPFARVF